MVIEEDRLCDDETQAHINAIKAIRTDYVQLEPDEFKLEWKMAINLSVIKAAGDLAMYRMRLKKQEAIIHKTSWQTSKLPTRQCTLDIQ